MRIMRLLTRILFHYTVLLLKQYNSFKKSQYLNREIKITEKENQYIVIIMEMEFITAI